MFTSQHSKTAIQCKGILADSYQILFGSDCAYLVFLLFLDIGQGYGIESQLSSIYQNSAGQRPCSQNPGHIRPNQTITSHMTVSETPTPYANKRKEFYKNINNILLMVSRDFDPPLLPGCPIALLIFDWLDLSG